MIIGFTGTSKGMTPYQKKRVLELLSEFIPEMVRHGDCIGADAEFHQMASSLGIKICIHPPNNDRKRAFCKADAFFPEKAYLKRNHDIVEMSNILIAAPEKEKEVLRSGTWAAVRYAKKIGKEVITCPPSES